MPNISYSVSELKELLQKDPSKKVVLHGGTFDLLHKGHVLALEKAAQLGDILIVHIEGDARVKVNKGEGRPIMSARDRAYLVASLKCVDYVVIQDTPTYDDSILGNLNPDIYSKAKRVNVSDEDREIRKSEFKEKYPQMEVVFIDEYPEESTTELIKKIKSLNT